MNWENRVLGWGTAEMSCIEIFNVNNKSCHINITFCYDLVENTVT